MIKFRIKVDQDPPAVEFSVCRLPSDNGWHSLEIDPEGPIAKAILAHPQHAKALGYELEALINRAVKW